MHIAGMILGCLLAAQSPETTPPAQTAAQPPRQAKQLAADLAARALNLPAASKVTGQPMTLLAALRASPDRRQQLEAVRAYWSLVQAVGEYRFCLDYSQGLEGAKASAADAAPLRLARASAAAMLRQAEFEATRAQYVLAGAANLPAGSSLPLPADRPHVGSYRTNLREWFAGRTPPEPAVLMDRILPIRRQAIDDQAAAVQAAEDVVTACADDAVERNEAGSAAIEARRELLRQQQAFLRIVCDYNRNIAEYGMVAAVPGASPTDLVAMLIEVSPQSAAPTPARIDSSVRPATATAPVGDSDGWRQTEPTSAPPGDSIPKSEPTPAPPKGSLKSLGGEIPTLQAPTDASGATAPETDETSPKPMVPVLPSNPQTRTARKPAAATIAPLAHEAGEAAGAAAVYPGLLDASAAARAKQLTLALHWDRSLPEAIGKPISLGDCLMREAGGNRQATIDAYWLVRERAAAYQVRLQRIELLDAIEPATLERRDKPAEMLELRRAQLAAKAALGGAHVVLVEAQHALAQCIGATNDSQWPLASTVPHSGRYQLKLDAQPRTLVESWPARRLAATIPGLGAGVQQRAAAVVDADAARAAAAAKYIQGGGTISEALSAVAAQTDETLALLATLTEYNHAIAEYVLLVMPPATPADELVRSLVVNP